MAALKLITLLLLLLPTMDRRIVIRRLGILRRRCCRGGVVAGAVDRRDANAIRASRILLSRRLSLGGISLRSVGCVFGGIKAAAGVDSRVDRLDVAVAANDAGRKVALAELVVDDGGVDEHSYEGEASVGGK